MTEKLVRDKIPEIIGNETNQPGDYRIANPGEMPDLLKRKLQEEVGELGIALESGDTNNIMDELVDVSEVLLAIGLTLDITSQTVEARRKEKKQDRGGFEKRIVMDF